MPEPVPAPTATEIVDVAEITMLPAAAVIVMVAADEDQDIANAKWALTLEDIAAWPSIRDSAGKIKRVGSIEFFEGVSGITRLGFRNRLRSRYGQTLLLSESGAVATGYMVTPAAAVSVTNDW